MQKSCWAVVLCGLLTGLVCVPTKASARIHAQASLGPQAFLAWESHCGLGAGNAQAQRLFAAEEAWDCPAKIVAFADEVPTQDLLRAMPLWHAWSHEHWVGFQIEDRAVDVNKKDLHQPQVTLLAPMWDALAKDFRAEVRQSVAAYSAGLPTALIDGAMPKLLADPDAGVFAIAYAEVLRRCDVERNEGVWAGQTKTKAKTKAKTKTKVEIYALGHVCSAWLEAAHVGARKHSDWRDRVWLAQLRFDPKSFDASASARVRLQGLPLLEAMLLRYGQPGHRQLLGRLAADLDAEVRDEAQALWRRQAHEY